MDNRRDATYRAKFNNNMEEYVKRDLDYLTKMYNWLYSPAGSNLQSCASEGVEGAQEILDELNMYIKTIEWFQVNDMFERAHKEVKRLSDWFRHNIEDL